jgi:hypothetical protein
MILPFQPLMTWTLRTLRNHPLTISDPQLPLLQKQGQGKNPLMTRTLQWTSLISGGEYLALRLVVVSFQSGVATAR